MEHVIVTISREYGAGGRKVGMKLAEELGVMCYDRAVIELAAEKTGMSAEFIEGSASKSSNIFYNIAQATFTDYTPMITYDLLHTDKAFSAQAEVIREIAAGEDAVIIGRCADYILRGNPNLIRVFLYGEKEDKLGRLSRELGMSMEDAREQMKTVDKGRASYHKTYTGMSWGARENYDLCINTTTTGIELAVAAIKGMALEKMKNIPKPEDVFEEMSPSAEEAPVEAPVETPDTPENTEE